jgi:predicted ATPase/DNA-binding SARP family transcriptional activator
VVYVAEIIQQAQAELGRRVAAGHSVRYGWALLFNGIVTGLRVRLLGPMQVRRDGRLLVVDGVKPKGLLAMLALNAGRVVSTGHLIDALWGEAPPETAVNAVQVYVSTIRRALEPAPPVAGQRRGSGELRRAAGGYLLDVPPEAVDVHRFQQLADQGRQKVAQGDAEAAATTLELALGLWEGPALADFSGLDFAESYRTGLEARRLSAVSDRIEADLGLGRSMAVIGELEDLVRRHPSQERLLGQLMLALYRTGRQADALRAYARGRDALVAELGLDLGPDLRRLYERILRQDPALAPLESAAAPKPPAEPSQEAKRRLAPVASLPMPLTSLVGRAREVEETTQLLRSGQARLVTLLGPGGTGKTRIALAVAHQLTEEFPDGVVFVGLAPIGNAADVLPEMHRALAVPEEPGQTPVHSLLSHLRERKTLLVLDNFEQVMDAAQQLIVLLQGAPGVALLVTSRAALNVTGERSVRVRPLPLPASTVPPKGKESRAFEVAESSDAVRMFLDRAAAASGLRLTEANATAVTAICSRLDGVPLALELAAARTTILTPEAMLSRLEHSLALLVAGPRDLPPRQRSLRATLDWSWDLLDPIEAATLAQLSLFPGGWTVETAEAVCEPGGYEVLETLARLLDKSLIQPVGASRFTMLHIVREYAVDILSTRQDADQIHQRFITWAVNFANNLDKRGRENFGSDPQATAAFEAELANLTAALEATERWRDGERLSSLAVALGRSWYESGRLVQGERWLHAALKQDTAATHRARLLHELGGYALVAHGNPLKAEQYLRSALDLYQPGGNIDRAMGARHTLANALRWQGRAAEALSEREQLVIEARQSGRSDLTLAVLGAELGELYDELGVPAKARPLTLAFRGVAEVDGSSDDQAYATAELALLALSEASDDAGVLIERCLRLVGHADVSGLARADVLEMLGIAQISRGRPQEAAPLLREAAQLMLETGYRLPFADTLSALGVTAVRVQEPDLPRAAQLFGAGADMRHRNGLGMVYRQLRQAYLEAVQEVNRNLSPDAVRHHWQQGATASRSTAGIAALIQDAPDPETGG